jgi:hypothetical protein
MIDNNQQFEKFLREFQPRHPGALPQVSHRHSSRRLAASAAIAFSLAASVWFTMNHPANQPGQISSDVPLSSVINRKYLPPQNITSLTQLSIDDPPRFDAALNEASRHQLPDFKNRDSTLRVLAKQ